MIKNNKGVTLITLTIAVIIILLVTGMIIYSANDGIYVKRLTNLYNDISNLRDKVSLYYAEYGVIPASVEYPDTSMLNSGGVVGANDTGRFLILELNTLDGLTLNYGKDYQKYKDGIYTNITDLKDIYVINENSHNIFYIEGIGVKQNNVSKIYYTDQQKIDEEMVQLVDVPKIDGEWNEKKGVNSPLIKDNMELVVYDENSKKWVEDTTNSKYSYNAGNNTTDSKDSQWANARVTIDGVESYFVWIPRYEYKIDSNSKKIEVKFIPTDQTQADDGYTIHPAFTENIDNGGWGEELPGIWVGKFENSRADTVGTTQGESTQIKVQPGVSSWRNETIGDMYTYCKEFSNSLNSHMLKNSEWGAVAYLTYSQYGRNGNEVMINNSGNYVTGSAGNSTSASVNQNTNTDYTSLQGMLASSTGNIYGIYDLSGGAGEAVVSYYNNSTNSTNFYNLYANSFARKGGNSNKYSTTYKGTSAQNNYIVGDATYETNNWNNDYYQFVDSDNPFFIRGGVCNSEKSSGIMAYNVSYGQKNEEIGFRLCLAIK